MEKDKIARIKPRTLDGFRDYLPKTMIPRERLIETARRVYRSYGFAPIDTPALEHLEILIGKGSGETDKQLYKFDHGNNKIGMRFDLTVPLARFVAQHINELGTPFKRYHVATVWRGERPQKGRYREFMQCDFDTIGTLAMSADIETALVIHELFQALGFDDFKIRINNRMVLNGLLDRLELADRSTSILRSLDKLGKIGADKVVAELMEFALLSTEQATEVVKLASIEGSNEDVLRQLAPLVAGSPRGEEGVAKLEELVKTVTAVGVPESRLQIDVSIARGLDYYTGTIYETFLGKLPSIGSVCSGGRYDNLAGLYTSQQLPGIGASLGLDRLLAAMEELGMLEKVATPAEVFMAYSSKERFVEGLQLASSLRAVGIGVEVYPDDRKSVGKQFQYAEERGCLVGIMVSDKDEDRVEVRTLATKDSWNWSKAMPIESLIDEVKSRLATR